MSFTPPKKASYVPRKSEERKTVSSPEKLVNAIRAYKNDLLTMHLETRSGEGLSWHSIEDIGHLLLNLERALETMKNCTDVQNARYWKEIDENIRTLRSNYDKYMSTKSIILRPFSYVWKKSHRVPVENLVRYSDEFLASIENVDLSPFI